MLARAKANPPTHNQAEANVKRATNQEAFRRRPGQTAAEGPKVPSAPAKPQGSGVKCTAGQRVWCWGLSERWSQTTAERERDGWMMDHVTTNLRCEDEGPDHQGGGAGV